MKMMILYLSSTPQLIYFLLKVNIKNKIKMKEKKIRKVYVFFPHSQNDVLRKPIIIIILLHTTSAALVYTIVYQSEKTGTE